MVWWSWSEYTQWPTVFQRSAMGQLLGYGEFILESAGQDQALRNVDYIPYPEQLYLEVCGLIFKDTEESPD